MSAGSAASRCEYCLWERGEGRGGCLYSRATAARIAAQLRFVIHGLAPSLNNQTTADYIGYVGLIGYCHLAGN